METIVARDRDRWRDSREGAEATKRTSRRRKKTSGKINAVNRTGLLILLPALLIGGFGLFVEALWWMLIIAGAPFIFGVFTGWRSRRV